MQKIVFQINVTLNAKKLKQQIADGGRADGLVSATNRTPDKLDCSSTWKYDKNPNCYRYDHNELFLKRRVQQSFLQTHL